MSRDTRIELPIKQFDVWRRNVGHYDVSTNDAGRIAKVRGGPRGFFVVIENKSIARNLLGINASITEATAKYFTTSGSALSWFIDQLVFEIIAAEGQKVETIDNWNVDSTVRNRV